MPLTGKHPLIQPVLSEIDQRLQSELVKEAIPGLSAAVVYGNDILWSKGYGYANLEDEIPATPETIYRVGSITKVFTATMLMILRDEGKLHLDEPVEKYFPEFKIRVPYPDPTPPTFRQLVSHTAGLPREAPLDYFQTLQFPELDELLASLKDIEMVYPSLTQYKYSNLGTSILGHALARIAGQPYEQFVETRILTPLEMSSSGFQLPPGKDAQMALGYSIPNSGDTPVCAPFHDFKAIAPAGQLFASVKDMARMISLQFWDGLADERHILKGSTLREMHAPLFIDSNWDIAIGVGWGSCRLGRHVCIGHDGGFQGYIADVRIIPALKIGVAIFTNKGTYMARPAFEILERLIPVIEKIHEEGEIAGAIPPEWSAYMGSYTIPEGLDFDIGILENHLMLVIRNIPPEYGAKLIPVQPGIFRMKGGPVDGELAKMILDDRGTCIQIRIGEYLARRIN